MRVSLVQAFAKGALLLVRQNSSLASNLCPEIVENERLRPFQHIQQQ